MQLVQGGPNNPRRMLFFGDNGIGKSELAASFPTPVVLNYEDGMTGLPVDQTAKLSTYQETLDAIRWLIEVDQQHQTIIVDTADWLEKIVFFQVADQRGKDTIEDIGYSKGYEAARATWHYLIEGFSRLWRQGRHVIFTAHLNTPKFKAPDADQYNYYAPALHVEGSSPLLDWCDEILFLRTKVNVIQKTEGFNQKRGVAIGGEERVMLTQERASHVAKNRLGLPYEMPLSWPASSSPLFGYLAKCRLMQVQTAGNIAGVVSDGSSKPAATANGASSTPVTDELAAHMLGT
ncbi:MAG: ATP-binding protein [Planctomycetes bacterium]|nr:ATP-binding protein [Planctomycetota bacterium]